MSNKFCQFCGSAMEDNSNFCQSCGKSQTAQAPQSTTPPPTSTYSAPTSTYSSPAPTYSSPAPSYSSPSYSSPYGGYNAMQTAKDVPLTVGNYIGMFFISAIPLVGFIMLLVWAFGSSANTNKKNYARAVLILSIIGGVLSAILSGVILPIIANILNNL